MEEVKFEDMVYSDDEFCDDFNDDECSINLNDEDFSNLNDSKEITFNFHAKDKKSVLKKLSELKKQIKKDFPDNYSYTFNSKITYKNEKVDKIEKEEPTEEDKLETLRNQILHSVIPLIEESQEIYVEEGKDYKEYITLLNTLENDIKIYQQEILLRYYYIGKIFSIFKKDYNKDYIQKIQTDSELRYHRTYISFILALFYFLDEFPIMKQSTLSIHFVKKYFTKIKTIFLRNPIMESEILKK